MDELLSFKEFLSTSSLTIPLSNFIFNLISTALFSYLTSLLFIKFGNSLSNREHFSKNFVLIGMTTMLIISVVKSSLALSLGLVGALSIIRFRAAIKEPEELAYLFLLISIGLGFGADQGKIVAVSFVLISSIVVLINKSSVNTVYNENLLFSISTSESKDLDLEKIIDILKQYCTMVSLRRFDESKDSFDASFSINIYDIGSLTKMKNDILTIDKTANVQYLDNRDIY